MPLFVRTGSIANFDVAVSNEVIGVEYLIKFWFVCSGGGLCVLSSSAIRPDLWGSHLKLLELLPRGSDYLSENADFQT